MESDQRICYSISAKYNIDLLPSKFQYSSYSLQLTRLLRVGNPEDRFFSDKAHIMIFIADTDVPKMHSNEVILYFL